MTCVAQNWHITYILSCTDNGSDHDVRGTGAGTAESSVNAETDAGGRAEEAQGIMLSGNNA